MIKKLENLEKEIDVNEDYIRSSKSSLKFSNINKLNNLNSFIDEYRKIVELFVNQLWEIKNVSSLLPKDLTENINTWLSARAIQSAGKQASGIVRGTREKQRKRLFIINKLNKQGMFKKARKLQKIYDKEKVAKPEIQNVCPELDSRFVKIDLNSKNSFDGWVSLTSLGNKIKLILPFKRTKHFNKMIGTGKIKKGIRISKSSITFNFSLKPKEMKKLGNVIGLDKGIKNLYTLSDGNSSYDDIHGWNFDKIIKKMARKKKGSKAFKKCQSHRKNYINWCLNQIDLTNIKTLNVEKLINVRKGKKTSRYLSSWTYSDIKSKLDNLALENGVRIKELNPTYTSQRCSKCGWTRKNNRKGKWFVCTKCGFAADADFNASFNISFDLPEITSVERQKKNNREGFYWNTSGQESIVPVVQEALCG